MNFEEAVDKSVESLCRLTTGMPALSKRWPIDWDTLYAAKASAKDILKNKEQFGTEYNPEDVAFNVQLKDAGDTFLREFDEQRKKYANFTPEKALQELKREEEVKIGKLKSKWGSEGNWKYSYDYSQDTASQINY